MSRRGFLGGCATCAGAMVIPMAGSVVVGGEAKKSRIRVIYSLHADVQPRPDWPNVGFDFKPVMERMTGALSSGCPEIEFIPTMATGPEQAKEILAKDESANIDGYVVMQMNCWNKVVQTMVASGKPVLYADFLYAGSGGFPGLHGRFSAKGCAELRVHCFVEVYRRGRSGEVFPDDREGRGFRDGCCEGAD